MWLAAGISLLSGAIGGVAGAWLSTGPTRAEARAKVRAALFEHRGAWHPNYYIDCHPNDDEYYTKRDFGLLAEMTKFEQVALAAHVPRRRVQRYLRAQRSAHEDCYEDGEGRILLSDPVELELRAATQAILDFLWHPWLSRVRR